VSIFGSITSAIFGNSVAATPAPTKAPTGSTAAPSAGSPAASAAAKTASANPATAPMSRSDLEALIANKVAAQSEDLNWKQSIVDLMKALKLDSSLSSRKELAKELGYTGALDGSAEMNVWLHKHAMAKLAESGGQVPDSLKQV
jgi:3-oxoacyl-ACP reductase-like protein